MLMSSVLKYKILLGVGAAILLVFSLMSVKMVLDASKIRELKSDVKTEKALRQVIESDRERLRSELQDQNDQIDKFKEDSKVLEEAVARAEEEAVKTIASMETEVDKLRNRPVTSCDAQAQEAIEWVESLRQ
jgi:uncharacterized protein (DUF3084 family)